MKTYKSEMINSNDSLGLTDNFVPPFDEQIEERWFYRICYMETQRRV